jgi:hypothetical protein
MEKTLYRLKGVGSSYRNPFHLMPNKMMLILRNVKPSKALIDAGCKT